jgi:hypothetical protein
VLNAMVVRVRLSSKHSMGTRRDVLVQVELRTFGVSRQQVQQKCTNVRIYIFRLIVCYICKRRFCLHKVEL